MSRKMTVKGQRRKRVRGGDTPGLDWEAFNKAVEAGTKLWADVPDPVAWVREIRGVDETKETET